MGNIFKKDQGSVQVAPRPGVIYPPPQQQQQQPVVQPHVQFVQQPQYVPQPQFAPQQPPQYRQPTYPMQQPSYPSAPAMPRYPAPPSFAPPIGQSPPSYYETDVMLSHLTGWSTPDIQRLRNEFLSYTNAHGVIDREGFRKLYVASLLNMTWDGVEREAEMAFRNFDVNQTGTLDFNEYITACSRLTRETNMQYPSPPPGPPMSSPPPMNPAYPY